MAVSATIIQSRLLDVIKVELILKKVKDDMQIYGKSHSKTTG